ncbi:cytochrome P450 [Nocardia transvalensis]|uniref:cytochrome P450 n=1 Tax=Nocardia transvalensis TaxID=37333 RepID=UPI0018930D28|nr:cytochrome P450 [Nocardia transvalensis]MBF6329568.1 cytochrome P450 [Nocardia transvalensis]
MAAPRIAGVRAAATLADLGFAPVASGVIARRRPVMALLERMQADSRAMTRMRRLRGEFGCGPVELVLPGRRIVIVTDPGDVGRVLAQAPTPFHPANREKRAALRQFQPHGVLLSEGPVRERRRAVNEAALDTGSPLHRLAEPFTETIADEAAVLIDTALREGRLDAARFTTAWWRLVRRLVLGAAARDDDGITDDLWRLRSAANWSFLALPHRRRRDRFFDGLYRYAESAQPDSLIGALAAAPADAAVDPVGQVPHWLFAFDAAGIALTRALAVLATHPEQYARAREDAAHPDRPELRPYLRAAMVESVRLWPTTPTILRDITEPVTWREGVDTAPGAALMIAVPAFHRDPDLVPFADTFAPEIWLDGRAGQYPQLVPFSAGPAECPGRNLVLFVTSTLLAHLLTAVDFTLTSHPRPTPAAPLPLTFDNFRLDFAVAPAAMSEPGSGPVRGEQV